MACCNLNIVWKLILRLHFWNMFESVVKHHNPNLTFIFLFKYLPGAVLCWLPVWPYSKLVLISKAHTVLGTDNIIFGEMVMLIPRARHFLHSVDMKKSEFCFTFYSKFIKSTHWKFQGKKIIIFLYKLCDS